MARRRRSPLKKALRAMAPHRVLWRVMSGPEVVSGIRSTFGTATKTTPAARKKKVAAMQRKAAAPAKKTAAKKMAGKRADPYAVALGIPGQNRQAAAKIAKAAQPAKKSASSRTGKTTGSSVPVRNPDGTFNGSRSVPTFGPAEQERNRQAWTGYVDPALRPRTPRTRRS